MGHALLRDYAGIHWQQKGKAMAPYSRPKWHQCSNVGPDFFPGAQSKLHDSAQLNRGAHPPNRNQAAGAGMKLNANHSKA